MPRVQGGISGGGFPLLDPSLHGIGVLRATLLSRLYSLDFTHFGSIIAVAGIIPAAWRYTRRAWFEAAGWIKHFFIASVSIPANDPINRSVSSWVLENVIAPRQLRFHTARTEVGRSADPGALVKKQTASVQYLPHWETAWFWHEKRLFAVRRSLDSFKGLMNDPSYDGIGGEELDVSCFGLSSDPVQHFVEMCRVAAEKKAQFYIIIYSRDRFGMSWKPKYRKPLRQLDTVHFDDKVKRALIADIRNYLDPRTQKLYQSRSMPYRRGYLFSGPPGTGKTSTATAIAGEFGLDLYEVKVPSIGSDGDLEQMFQEIPPRCIVLLEDIDCVWVGREPRSERQMNDSDSTSSNSSVTLSGLLNVLDGVGSQEGRVVIMTTNKPEQLDSALVRPGRVDFKVYLGHITQQSAQQMFMRMFAPDLLSWAQQSAPEPVDALDQHVSVEQLKLLASQFAQQIPENTFTPSQLQGFFQRHLSSAVLAANSISAWVEEERALG